MNAAALSTRSAPGERGELTPPLNPTALLSFPAFFFSQTQRATLAAALALKLERGIEHHFIDKISVC